LFGKTPLKAQNDQVFQKFGGAMATLAPPGYAYARTSHDVLIHFTKKAIHL